MPGSGTVAILAVVCAALVVGAHGAQVVTTLDQDLMDVLEGPNNEYLPMPHFPCDRHTQWRPSSEPRDKQVYFNCLFERYATRAMMFKELPSVGTLAIFKSDLMDGLAPFDANQIKDVNGRGLLHFTGPDVKGTNTAFTTSQKVLIAKQLLNLNVPAALTLEDKLGFKPLDYLYGFQGDSPKMETYHMLAAMVVAKSTLRTDLALMPKRWKFAVMKGQFEACTVDVLFSPADTIGAVKNKVSQRAVRSSQAGEGCPPAVTEVVTDVYCGAPGATEDSAVFVQSYPSGPTAETMYKCQALLGSEEAVGGDGPGVGLGIDVVAVLSDLSGDVSGVPAPVGGVRGDSGSGVASEAADTAGMGGVTTEDDGAGDGAADRAAGPESPSEFEADADLHLPGPPPGKRERESSEEAPTGGVTATAAAGMLASALGAGALATGSGGQPEVPLNPAAAGVGADALVPALLGGSADRPDAPHGPAPGPGTGAVTAAALPLGDEDSDSAGAGLAKAGADRPPVPAAGAARSAGASGAPRDFGPAGQRVGIPPDVFQGVKQRWGRELGSVDEWISRRAAAPVHHADDVFSSFLQLRQTRQGGAAPPLAGGKLRGTAGLTGRDVERVRRSGFDDF